MILRLNNGPTFSKWPKQVGVLAHSAKSLLIAFNTKNDVVLTYKLQNAYHVKQ